MRKPTSLDDTENRYIIPDKWRMLKPLANPPKQDWIMRPTDSLFKRMAECPKEATKKNSLEDWAGEKLTGEENLAWMVFWIPRPGEKSRSERPPIATADQRRSPWRSTGRTPGAPRTAIMLLFPLRDFCCSVAMHRHEPCVYVYIYIVSFFNFFVHFASIL